MADNLSIAPGASYTVATDEIAGVQYQKVKLIYGGSDVAILGATSKATASFTRPANTTAYTADDNVSNSTTSVTPLTFTMDTSPTIIRRVRIRKSDQTVATPTIRLWLFDATFTVGSVDNAAFAQPLQDTIGIVDVDVVNAGSDDAVGWTNCDIPNSAATVYGLLQTKSAFTPANAEVFTVSIWYLNT